MAAFSIRIARWRIGLGLNPPCARELVVCGLSPSEPGRAVFLPLRSKELVVMHQVVFRDQFILTFLEHSQGFFLL